ASHSWPVLAGVLGCFVAEILARMHHDAVPDSSLGEQETRTCRIALYLGAQRHRYPADDFGGTRGRGARDLPDELSESDDVPGPAHERGEERVLGCGQLDAASRDADFTMLEIDHERPRP